MDKFEANGYSLREDYKSILVKGIKSRYILLKIFGGWIMICSGLSSITMIKSYLFDDEFSTGLFQYMPIKMVALIISMIFIILLLFGGYKLFKMASKIQKSAENDDFIWKMGRLTNKERVVRRNKGTSCIIYIDNERCTPIGLSHEEFEAATLGDEYILIHLNNVSVPFAIKA